MTIENLSFSYALGEPLVLRAINAAAQPRRITAVLGPNAAGKSTLLKCMIGALRPASGRVLIDGQDVRRLKPREAAQRIAYVPQRSIVSAAFTVRQVIELGRYALPASPKRIEAALQQLQLHDIADRPYHALSVGQQQRVTLARAVAQLEVDGLLALDEPVSAMDLSHVHACMRLMKELAAGGATVIIAMHDLSLAAAIADDVWLLAAGALVESGPVAEALSIESLREVFEVGFQWVQVTGGPMRLLADVPSVPPVTRIGGP